LAKTATVSSPAASTTLGDTRIAGTFLWSSRRALLGRIAIGRLAKWKSSCSSASTWTRSVSAKDFYEQDPTVEGSSNK
jgi:hypothetical protein